MEWRDQGILLSKTPFGETAVIIDALTQKNGRVRAVLRNGQSRKFRSILQIGNILDITWRARLSEHMGSVQVDVIKSYPEILDSRLTLAGVTTLSSMLTTFLEEREPHTQVYVATVKLHELLIHPDIWCVGYFYWELALLEALGFGLDVSKCVVSGDTENLEYLSPKSGCAVSQQAAGQWADRLLLMPRILMEKDKKTSDVFDGLLVLSYFWLNKVIPALDVKTIPMARQRFMDLMQRYTSV
jgi:DNA repair protein RecO (recombination protein O)